MAPVKAGWVTLFMVLGAAGPARAAEEGASSPVSPPRTVDVWGSVGGGAMQRHLGSGFFGGDFGLGYRFTPTVSLGVLAGYFDLDRGDALAQESSSTLWRVGGDTRYYAFTSTNFDAWVGGEFGFALSSATAKDNGARTGKWFDRDESRAAPYAGAGGGVDLVLATYLSLGLTARALLVPFGTSVFAGAPQGPSPAIYGGIALGLHFPVSR